MWFLYRSLINDSPYRLEYNAVHIHTIFDAMPGAEIFRTFKVKSTTQLVQKWIELVQKHAFTEVP